jgi:hypothetical protein
MVSAVAIDPRSIRQRICCVGPGLDFMRPPAGVCLMLLRRGDSGGLECARVWLLITPFFRSRTAIASPEA